MVARTFGVRPVAVRHQRSQCGLHDCLVCSVEARLGADGSDARVREVSRSRGEQLPYLLGIWRVLFKLPDLQKVL